ncbi:DNA repair protein [Achromobacter phage vB_AxyP_19-32_Axy11]|uniref:DUF4326 domain-containing protein n=1 Tax=Achromobacter phage vB_AxyP_19-32_Axy11 TaxID=2591042 RepID=A0A514CUA5_9CAUD|nr:DNA repair protein [Achromobacter phage vB_AxyP_19-32_Axy11]QDH84049.1 hypothetical protein Axy11_003 [Achromobacter phage vB_AxyP_19-32_Axy11]
MSIIVVNKYKLVNPDREDIYIGRGSPLGNPYPIGKDGTREEVIRKYAVWLDHKIKTHDAAVCNALNNILSRHRKGQVVKLVCFCKPQACHGDIIKSVVENFNLSR